ncbi:MAG: YCF48-related protein [bacterium]|nr:YCF48-related protein [bacterium]
MFRATFRFLSIACTATLLSTLCALSALAQFNFVPTNGPYSAIVNDVKVLSSRSQLMAITTAGVFFSSDSGYHWVTRLEQEGWNLAYDNNHEIIYATILERIHYSTDLGVSWTRIDSTRGLPEDNYYIVYYSQLSNRVIAFGTMGSVYYSTNAGTNWFGSNSLYNAEYCNFVISVQDSLIIATSGGLFFSTNGGVSWNPLGNSLLGIPLVSILRTRAGTLIAGSENGRIYRSTNHGTTWSIQGFFPNCPLRASSLTSSETLLMGSGGSFPVYLQSQNDGVNWTTLPIPSPVMPCYNIIYDSLTHYSYFCNADGIFRLNTINNSWTNLTNGLRGSAMISIGVTKRGSLLTGTWFGIFRSSDEGQSWSMEDTLSAWVWGFSSIDSNLIFASVYSGYANRDGLYRSLDDGQHWTRIAFTGALPCIVVQHPVTRALYTTDQTTMYRSTNSGTTWEFVSQVFGDLAINPVTGTIFRLTGLGYFRSFDLGRTWQPLHQNSSMESLNHVFTSSQGRLFIQTFEGIEYTFDDGNTWQYSQLPVGSSYIDGMCEDDNHNLYCLSGLENQRVLRSTDQGTSWSVFIDETPADAYQLAINSRFVLFSSTVRHGVYRSNTPLTMLQREHLLPQLTTNCYPNPFNSTTTLHYSLPKPSDVTISVTDILGRQVKEVLLPLQPTGERKWVFDGSNLSSGNYYYQVSTSTSIATGKITLVK